MIYFTSGDILKVNTEAIVNPVNCVGTMGRGLALQFKRAYPRNFKAYAMACRCKEVIPGRMLVFETDQLVYPHFIVNFPTKRHWRDTSLLGDIAKGLGALASEVQTRNIRSIAVPALGCGLGGLSWRDVRPLIEGVLGQLPHVHTLVFEPQDGDKDARDHH